ncbi:MAG: hypothetical protein GY862_18225 [Gammaproteobacteria bacterium]|nr:hypothetical protein [Gammaproteobacteria bacterium]
MKHKMQPLLSVFAISLFLIFCLIPHTPVKADYGLPKIMERLVLLIPLSEIGFDEENLIITVDQKKYRFVLDTFWMQDRIFSDGICTGSESDAQSRIHDIRLALTDKPDSQVLIELVHPEDKSWFIVSYLKLFNPEVEFHRYFPEQEYYDTVELPFDSKPNDKNEFATKFEEPTDKSRQRLKALDESCPMEMEVEKARFAAGILTIPQVAADFKPGGFTNVQFKLSADGRWDLINVTPE